MSTLRTLAGGAELSYVEFLPCYTCQVLGTPSLNPQGGALLGEGAQTGRFYYPVKRDVSRLSGDSEPRLCHPWIT